MTQVRYFGFVKAEEPWTGNQFKMYAGKNGSTFGSKVPAGSVVECGYKSISSADRVKIPLREDGPQGFLLGLRERRRGAVKEVCMKFIHIRNRAYDRYVREDNEVCLEQRMVRINGRFCWRWCVYADCGGNVVEMFKTLKAAKVAYSDVLA